MNERNWTSNAEWPDEAVALGYDKITTDYHYSEDEARAVCRALERCGMGGDGKVFPVRVWTGHAP